MKPANVMSIRRAYAILGWPFPAQPEPQIDNTAETPGEDGDFREVQESDFIRAIRDGQNPVEECA